MLIKIDPPGGWKKKSRLSLRQGSVSIVFQPLIWSACLGNSPSLSLSVAAPYHSCPFLVKHLTSCIPVIGGGLFVFVVITLLQTSFTDPGILPRATPDEAADIEKQIGKGRLSCKWSQDYMVVSSAFDFDIQYHLIEFFFSIRWFPSEWWELQFIASST